jgi:hypothetical protein
MIAPPASGNYELTSGTTYLLTLSGPGITENSQVEVRDKQDVNNISYMTWANSRMELTVTGAGLAGSNQPLDAKIEGDTIASIIISWIDPNAGGDSGDVNEGGGY